MDVDGDGRDAESCRKQLVQGRTNPWSLMPVAELHHGSPDYEQPGKLIAQCQEQALRLFHLSFLLICWLESL